MVLASSLTVPEFLDGAFAFSRKRYLTFCWLIEKKLIGFIDDIDRKKGLIEEITIIDLNKRKIKPKEVKRMYIVPSGFYKLSNGKITIYDATKWNEYKCAHDEHIKAGNVLLRVLK